MDLTFSGLQPTIRRVFLVHNIALALHHASYVPGHQPCRRHPVRFILGIHFSYLAHPHSEVQGRARSSRVYRSYTLKKVKAEALLYTRTTRH